MEKKPGKYKPPAGYAKIEMPDYGTTPDKPKRPTKIIRGTQGQRSGRGTFGLA